MPDITFVYCHYHEIRVTPQGFFVTDLRKEGNKPNSRRCRTTKQVIDRINKNLASEVN